MNILHVTKKYPDALGGDSVVVSNLQKQQELAGHEVAILTSNCQQIKNGEHIYKFGLVDSPAALDKITLRRLVSLFCLFFKAFRVLYKERPNMIHSHSIDMAFFVSFAARFYRIPMVHTFHIVTFYDDSQSALRRRSELWLARAAGLKIITAPNAHDAAALNNAGLRQAVVLPNGVDLEFWRPELAAKSTPASNYEFTFLSIGRLEQQKGYEYLIKATALLRSAMPEKFRVIIAGEGSQQKILQELARSCGVQDIVEFVGRKTAEEVRSLLIWADAAIFSSLYETTPLTLLEAWAIGVPVITTPVGILRGEPVDTAKAYLAQLRNEKSLMNAMQECMTNGASRAKIAAAGREEAKKYAWPGITQIADSLYRSVL
jgi:glycosyltransferase involved in cell wall biosynthesis